MKKLLTILPLFLIILSCTLFEKEEDYLKNNPNINLKAIRDFDFTRDVSLNVGVLLRGANEITVAKINEVLKHLLDNNIIQNIYASYGIEYVSPK